MLGAIIGAGLSIGASALGSWLGNKRRKEAQEAYDAAMSAEMGNLDSEINGNYLEKADARNALRKVTDSNTETLRQLNTDAIRGGASDEAKVAMASQLNKRTADVVGDLVALGEQRKDALRREKRAMSMGQIERKYMLDSDTTGIDTLVSGIGTAAQALGSAYSSSGSTTPIDTTPTDTAAIAKQGTDHLIKAGQQQFYESLPKLNIPM